MEAPGADKVDLADAAVAAAYLRDASHLSGINIDDVLVVRLEDQIVPADRNQTTDQAVASAEPDLHLAADELPGMSALLRAQR